MKNKYRSILIVISFSLLFCISCFANPVFATSTISSSTPELENPVTPAKDGSFLLKTGDLLDLIIPETIHGVTANAIAAHAFQGCDMLRSVTIPITIHTIGANAFANCENLKVIIFEGRADTAGLLLGAGWSGDAQLIFADPDLHVPSDALEQFISELTAAETITTVDNLNLDAVRLQVLALQAAYGVLDPTEITPALSARYLEALAELLTFIETSENRINTIPAPAAPSSDFTSMPEDNPMSDAHFDSIFEGVSSVPTDPFMTNPVPLT